MDIHFMLRLPFLFVSFFFRLLELNIEKVLGGRTGVRFFVPLCGKAVDMKWCVQLHNHTVFHSTFSFFMFFPLCGSQVGGYGPFGGWSGNI